MHDFPHLKDGSKILHRRVYPNTTFLEVMHSQNHTYSFFKWRRWHYIVLQRKNKLFIKTKLWVQQGNKSNKWKLKLLHLGRNNPVLQYRRHPTSGQVGVELHFAAKKCEGAIWTHWEEVCQQVEGGESFSLLSPESSSGLPSERKMWIYWSESVGRPQRQGQVLEHFSNKKRWRPANFHPVEEKYQQHLISV